MAFILYRINNNDYLLIYVSLNEVVHVYLIILRMCTRISFRTDLRLQQYYFCVAFFTNLFFKSL